MVSILEVNIKVTLAMLSWMTSIIQKHRPSPHPTYTQLQSADTTTQTASILQGTN